MWINGKTHLAADIVVYHKENVFTQGSFLSWDTLCVYGHFSLSFA
jgi:hypothetical protein